MASHIYGIKNCDTMKKAFKWLEGNNIKYEFYDYKKVGVAPAILESAIQQHGWENVINRRGTTWRKLAKETQETMNNEGALKVSMDNPSIIKRPLLIHKGNYYLGFKDELYSDVFG